MPSAEQILAQLGAAAQRGTGVAIAWHAIFLLLGLALALGFRPSRRLAGGLLAVPLASVSIVAADHENTFNALVFAVLTVALALLAHRERTRPVALVRSPMVIAASFALVLGWFYPHFRSGSPFAYAFASPLGVIPCATLYAVIGLALFGFAPLGVAYRLVLAGVGFVYGVYGAFRLGVWIDLGLVGVAAVLASTCIRLQPRAARRRLTVMRPVFPILLFAIASACGGSAPATATPTSSSQPTTTQTQPSATAPLPDRDPALAHKLVAEGAVLVDVRTPEEYAARHIEGAVNVPVDDVASHPEQIRKLTGGDVHKPIVVYCGSGKRAGRAKEALVSQGHDRVTNLGGIDDWDKK
jgi:phage shock protein E